MPDSRPAAGLSWGAAAAPRTVPEGTWDLLLLCVAVHLAVSVGRIHQLFPLLLPLKLALLTGVLAIGLSFMDQRGLRRLSDLHSPTTTCVVLLLVWAIFSVPGALNRGLALELVTDSFVKTVLLYLLMVGAVRSVKDVERLAWVYFAGVALYAAVVVARFDVGGGGDWRLGGIYYYDANDFGTLAVTALPLGLYFTVGRRPWWQRLAGLAGIGALSVGFIRSGSRGGFIALIAVAMFVVFRYSTIPARWRTLGVAIVAVVFLATASDRYWTQMRTIFDSDSDYNRTAEGGRVAIWKRGIRYAAQHPFFGVGADNFPVAEGTISPLASRQEYGIGLSWRAAHNAYVQIGAELGFPGLIFFLLAIVSAWRSLRAIARSPQDQSTPQQRSPPLAQALAASLLGFTVGAFFLSLAYHEMPYALLALAVGLRKVSRHTALAPAAATVARGWSQISVPRPPALPPLQG